MAWVITRDCFVEKDSTLLDGGPAPESESVVGRSSDNFVEGTDTIRWTEFRLLDDDRNIYYYGISNNNSSFSPLNWAQSYAGCTHIQYLENGKWATL